MAPITRLQTGMIGRYRNFLHAKRYNYDGFETRELAMAFRLVGGMIADDLPGIGMECKWLGACTDQDAGPYG